MRLGNKQGKKAGVHGITVQIVDKTKKQPSKSLTIHGLSVERVFAEIRQLFDILEKFPDGVIVWRKKTTEK